MTFAEEERIALGGGQEVVRPLGNLVETVLPANLGETFDLLHPETGEVIGQATYQDAYILLSSAYRHVARKRDAALAPPQTE
ncbi:hypothetical protein D9M70_629890 [compost metagenome]